MQLEIDDLGRHGVWLIGPQSERFEEWRDEALAGQGALSWEDEQAPVSAVLVNGSGRSVLAWALIWRLEDGAGQWQESVEVVGAHRMPTALLPFGAVPERDGLASGDKRWVRPAGAHAITMRRAAVVLDGVFWADGCFAGENRTGLWDWVRVAAQELVRAGRLAAESEGDAAAVFARIGEAMGMDLAVDSGPVAVPPPRVFTPSVVRWDAVQFAAEWVRSRRRMLGDDEALRQAAAWRAEDVPEFRRL